MAKKVMGDNRKAYVEKKPFYKRIWLWIVVILLIFAGIGIANGGNNNTTNKVSYANYKKVKLSKVDGTTKTEAKKFLIKSPKILQHKKLKELRQIHRHGIMLKTAMLVLTSLLVLKMVGPLTKSFQD